MTTGTMGYNGLAVGLYGEHEIVQKNAAVDFLTLTAASGLSGDYLVLRNSSNTEVLYVESTGNLKMRVTGSSSAPAYCGFNIEGTVSASSTGAWYCAGDLRLTAGTQASAAQLYALNVTLVTSGTNTDGRDAVLQLNYNYGNGQTAAAASFINFNDDGSDVPALFTLPGITASSGGCFETVTDNAITHGLVVYIGNTKYWIAVLSTSV